MRLVIILFFINIFLLYGQTIHYYNHLNPPLNETLSISSNYGDIRSSSFHFGIDYTTKGRRGLPIFAIDSGYVSRIKVEAGGYGRAIYINHNSGITSVYAHLDSFSFSITQFVKNKQYENQKFSIDILLEPTVFKIKKGEIIGYSGNSGQSTGPHLHFELRNTKSQSTLYPFIFSFHQKDTLPPVIEKVLLYHSFSYLSKDTLPAIKIIPFNKNKTTNSTSQNPKAWEVPEKFFIGLQAFDYLFDKSRKFNFYHSKVLLDQELIFEMKFDEMPFTETNLVSGIIDFQRRNLTSENIILQYQYSNLSFTPIKKAIHSGMITLNDTLTHTLTIEIYDFSGNFTTCNLQIRVSKKKGAFFNNNSYKEYIVAAGKQKIVKLGNTRLIFYPNTFYDNTKLFINKIYDLKLLTGEIIEIGHENIPVKSVFGLEIPITNVKPSLYSKIVVTRINGKVKESIGGEIKDNTIVAKTRKFGRYTLELDTIPPIIEFLNVKENEPIKQNFITVKITDNLSGIKSYNGYIDDNWVLFEYDLKNSTLVYTFDEKCIVKNSIRKLQIFVEDNRGNLERKRINFFY